MTAKKDTRRTDYRDRVIGKGGAQRAYLFDAETLENLAICAEHNGISHTEMIATWARRSRARIRR